MYFYFIRNASKFHVGKLLQSSY